MLKNIRRTIEHLVIASAIIITIIALAQLFAVTISYADDNPVVLTEDMIIWEPNSDGDNTCTITGYTENLTATDIIVPEKFTSRNGVRYTVTRLQEAFSNNNSIVKVSLPATIQEIGTRAFYMCENLKTVIYSSSLCPNIGDYAFYGDSSLFTFSKSSSGADTRGASIGEYAFYGCSILTIYYISEISIIPRYAFYGCLTSNITIPDSVEEIQEKAFAQNRYLSTVKMSKSLQVISDDAFEDCENLNLAVITPAKKSVTINKTQEMQLHVWFKSKYHIITKVDWHSGNSTVATIDVVDNYNAKVTAIKAGYSDISAEVSYKPGVSEYTIVAEGRITVPQNHTVSFDANGGSNAPQSQIKENGIDLVLRHNVPSRAGYIFQGWATKATGNVVYNPGDIYSKDEHVILYAVWNECPHNYSISETIKQASCDSDGKVRLTCSKCKHSIEQAIPATGHNYGLESSIMPTCMSAGRKSFVCGNCGDSYTENLPALGHNWNEGTVIKEASCEEDGIRSFVCSNDLTHTKTETIPATGHSWNEPEYTWGEGNTTVRASRICKHDSGHSEEETVPVSQMIIKQATCKEKGKTKYTSGTFENDAFAVQEKTLENIDALGHSISYVPPQMPTCEEHGHQGYWTCARCGSMFSDSAGIVEIAAPEAISATGHQYDEGEITNAPTCTLNGTKTFTCANCGNTYTESVHATGHDWNNGKVTKEATCEENGVRTYTCKNDINHTKTEVIPATGHDLNAVAKVESTCTESGIEAHWECGNCSSLFSDADGAYD